MKFFWNGQMVNLEKTVCKCCDCGRKFVRWIDQEIDQEFKCDACIDEGYDDPSEEESFHHDLMSHRSVIIDEEAEYGRQQLSAQTNMLPHLED